MSELPSRLHHSAVVVKDLGASREFYSEVIGLPLAATWCERLPEGIDFCHAFFELADGGAIALFQFADNEYYERMKRPAQLSRYHHLALNGTPEYQHEVKRRAEARGLEVRVTDHGYCTSLYVTDPDGHVVEITVDNAVALANASMIRDRAGSELSRWLGGDHRVNNDLRQHGSP